ncbi:MAG: Hsp20/alpha crystallin family protein [Deltaproteobacteria bacterium]|nr:Hsp20/alpha crystallin family protein [Deltaproteobacteria bacterium]
MWFPVMNSSASEFPTLGFKQLHDELTRFLDGASYETAAPYPPVSIWLNEEGAVVRADMPGMNPDKLDISVLGSNVTLKGERTFEPIKEDARFLRQERGFGQFTRQIELPFRVQSDGVSATYSNGVLELSLPRAESDKPKKIVIK